MRAYISYIYEYYYNQISLYINVFIYFMSKGNNVHYEYRSAEVTFVADMSVTPLLGIRGSTA
jgi:hypothetical protein